MGYVSSPSYKPRTVNVTPYIIGILVAAVALVTIPATLGNLRESAELKSKIQLEQFDNSSTLANGMLFDSQSVNDIQPQATGDCGTTLQGDSCLQPQLQQQAYTPIQGNYSYKVQYSMGNDDGMY